MTLAFNQIETGDLSFRLKFRSNDYLKQEEIEFNNMMSSVSEKIRSIQTAGLDAAASLNKLEKSLRDESADDSIKKNSFVEFRNELNQLIEKVGKFKLDEKSE